MGRAFTWLRPNDLVWPYWVNNYLMGQDAPVFDILAWNADGTNLPAELHSQFLDIFANNPFPTPGARCFLGTPLDLSAITVPAFVMGAVNDHLTPWRGTYRSTQLLGGDCTFVLSNAGHIAGLVNPPSHPKAHYFTAPDAGIFDAETWLGSATKVTGSWWQAWAEWEIQRSGARMPAPAGAVYALAPAPGDYVRDH